MASTSSLCKTKKSVNCDIFGAPRELSDSVLPTYEDIIKYFLWLRHETRIKTVSEIGEIIVSKLIELWNKASVPVVSRNRIIKMFKDYHDQYRNVLKPLKGRKNNEKYKLKLKIFKRMLKINCSIFQRVNVKTILPVFVKSHAKFQRTSKCF